jgi:hypothetical protein
MEDELNKKRGRRPPKKIKMKTNSKKNLKKLKATLQKEMEDDPKKMKNGKRGTLYIHTK